ncbi:MAG: hypothetical protein AAF637_06740 [Pseudomonadota bacterium]
MHRVASAAALVGAMLLNVEVNPALAQDSGCGATGVTGADTEAPCFSDVSDILGGQRDLLPTDDLMVTIGFRGGGTTTVKNLPLFTDDLKPNPQSQHLVADTDCDVRGTINEQTPLFMRLGRIYNLKYDVVVNSLLTIPASDDCGQTFFVTDATTEEVLHIVGTSESPLPRMTLLDADLDGYDDIFSMTRDDMQFHSPEDVDKPTSEMIFRFVLSSTSAGFPFSPRADPVSGDFDGDGAEDIAWVAAEEGKEVLIHFVSVCPAAGRVVRGTTCSQGFEIIPWPETIDTGQEWVAPEGTEVPGFALAAGDYDGILAPGTNVPDDELMLIVREIFGGKVDPVHDGHPGTFPAMVAKAYAFGGSGWSDIGGLVLPGSTAFDGLNVPLYVASGRLDRSQRKEQVAFAASGVRSVAGIWVLNLDEDLSLNVGHRVVTSGVTYGVNGVAIGRFDPPGPDFQPLGTPELDFDQQIAVLSSTPWCGDAVDCTADIVLQIYETDNPTFTPERKSSVQTTVPLSDEHFSFELISSPLQAGDLQGRSLLLGPPEKATIAHTQANTVLGMPPMHVDFVSESPGDDPPAPPTVFNVSVFPTTFNAQYSAADTTSAKLSTKSTTSYTYARKESAQEKISYGVPDLGGVSVAAKESAKQTHKDTVSETYDTYSSQAFSMTETTEYDDQVTFTTNRMNIFSYPVIGVFVCPAGSPDCSAEEKLPLHVQFSGVDKVTHHKPTVASVLEWYQPAHEPGNLFSYPANQEQLIADQPQGKEPRYSQLAPPPSESSSWSSNANEQTTASWTSGGTAEQTAGTVSNHSFDASVSASGKVGIGGFGLSASASYDTSKSTSTSTLNSSTTSFDASSGVTLSQTEVLNTPEYNGETFIFGVEAPEGTLQTDIAPATNIKGQGALRVAFAANPLTSESDVWWRQAYGPEVVGKPDVGLSHPSRWSQDNPTDPTPGAERVWFNCPVGYTSSPTSPACRPTTTKPTPANVAQEPFYRIKGLFVTPGETAAGPTTNRVTLGDTVTLQARVYNYSLTNMPAGAQVHVEFYAQPWGDGEFAPAPADPDAFASAAYIGKDVLPAIPAFCGGASADETCVDNPERNWAFAEVQWDTATLAPQPADVTNWKLWVVTWMELGGELVAEPEGHGLTAIPDADLNSLADVPVEPYSNNHGFYNQLITLIPPSDGAATAALAVDASAAGAKSAKLQLRKLRVKNQRRRGGEPMIVLVKLESNQTVDDVAVNFYDGNPQKDGILFDAEMIPHIAADQPFTVVVPYRRTDCASRRLYVEAFSVSNDLAPAFAETKRKIRPDIDCRGDRSASLQ